MIEVPCLLSKIESKYILSDILSFAFPDFKNTLKFIRYNKSLINKLKIDINDYYKYEYKREINKETYEFFNLNFIILLCQIILFLIYILIYCVKGTFNENNLIKDYNKTKKIYVDIINSYIIFILFGFYIISFLLLLLLIKLNIFFNNKWKFIIFLIKLLLDFIYFILQIVKYSFSKNLLIKDEEDGGLYYWFLPFDIIIIWLYITLVFFELLYLVKVTNLNEDIFNFYLIKFKSINIIYFELPFDFVKLGDKAKIEYIFREDNIKEYKYQLKSEQINFIKKINYIRNEHNIPFLNYDISYCKIPDFIINEKTDLVFNKHKNIFKFKPYYYLFKYPKNEFQNLLNEPHVLSIITNDLFDQIEIIEQDDIEFISIYNYSNKNEINLNRSNTNNNINTNNNVIINTNNKVIINNDIGNSEDILRDNTLESNITEFSDIERNKNIIIKNIKIKKNVFENLNK